MVKRVDQVYAAVYEPVSPYDFGLFRTLQIILGVVKGKQNAVTILVKLLENLISFNSAPRLKVGKNFQKTILDLSLMDA